MPANAKQFYVYILTTQKNTALYVGVTNDLARRMHEHRSGTSDGFTKRYNIFKLVYFEVFDSSYSAIVREKQLKAGSRAKKIALIESENPEWLDLFEAMLSGDRS